MAQEDQVASQSTKKGLSGWRLVGTIALVMLATLVATLIAVKIYLFPSDFKPVVLSAAEERQLSRKLERLEDAAGPGDSSHKELLGPSLSPDELDEDGFLKPEKYSEEGGKREIYLTERELNGLLANNTDLARKVAIDLAQDLISAKILLPMDPDFPVLGGKTIRVRAGVELAYRAGRPVVKLRGISVMGVPLPNAWLGGLKNIDLIEEYGDAGFWHSFSEGVENIQVQDGKLTLRLKE